MWPGRSGEAKYRGRGSGDGPRVRKPRRVVRWAACRRRLCRTNARYGAGCARLLRGGGVGGLLRGEAVEEDGRTLGLRRERTEVGRFFDRMTSLSRQPESIDRHLHVVGRK